MSFASRFGDSTRCPEASLGVIPHMGGPIEGAVPVCIEINGKGVARLADYADCMFPADTDMVVEGAATVTVCGLPVGRTSDRTAHGGEIWDGSDDVIVGGPKFKLPRNFKLLGPLEFRNLVLRDLYLLSTTRTGQCLFKGLAEQRLSLTIEPTEDDNGYCIPDFTSRSIPRNVGSKIQYNPNIGMFCQNKGGGYSPLPGPTVLGHELVHAYHNARGSNEGYYIDTHSPGSEPNMSLEEGKTIGAGSSPEGDPENEIPTENSLRKELGLPLRENHLGWEYPPGGGLKRDAVAAGAAMRLGECK